MKAIYSALIAAGLLGLTACNNNQNITRATGKVGGVELRVIENVCSGFNDLSIEIYDEKGSVMASLKARKNQLRLRQF